MDLYFLRHGDAEPAEAGLSDAERALTRKGQKTTRAEAEGMARLGVRPEVILTSPLVRARETADIVAEVLGTGPPVETELLACGCRLGELQQALAPHMGRSSVMVVGHEPDFGLLVGQLSGGSRVAMKKGGLARLSLYAVEPCAAELRWLLTPEHLLL